MEKNDSLQAPQYDDKYLIVKDKETFLEHIAHKFKKAWFNKEEKLCISEFILLGDNQKYPDKKFSYVKVIKGVAQKGKNSMDYDFLFSGETLVFLGYLERDQIETELKNLKNSK